MKKAEAPPVRRCNSCHTARRDLTRIHVGIEGMWVCPDPTACRRRAEDAGIWGTGVAA
jgi:hypothetical protein